VPVRGLVHLWSLDAEGVGGTTLASLEASQRLGCQSALHLFQACVRTPRPRLPRLWLVTRGA
jgi:hypothetical protein